MNDSVMDLVAKQWQSKQKPKKPRAKDVRDMTVRELGILAEEVRSAPAGTRKMRRAADRMCAASLCLEDSGALQQMIWWCTDIEPEAPPDARAEIIEMPPR